jgi:hypothetical protein
VDTVLTPSSTVERQPGVEPWPALNGASKLACVEILLPFSHFRNLSTALTSLSLGFPAGLVPIMLLPRILFGMRLPSHSHYSIFNVMIFDMLGPSDCLYIYNSLLLSRVLVTKTGFGLVIGFINRLQLQTITHNYL